MFKRCILSFLGLVALLNVSGFSYRSHGWLSNADYLAIAADRAAKTKLGETTYKDGADLLSKNPDCCEINRFDEGASGLFWKLLGWNIVGVKLIYRTDRYEKFPYMVQLYAIDTDGRVRDSIGDEISSPTESNYLTFPD